MAEIGFVLRITIAAGSTGIGFVSHCRGGSRTAPTDKLGLFCAFGSWPGFVCVESPSAMVIERVPRLWAAAQPDARDDSMKARLLVWGIMPRIRII